MRIGIGYDVHRFDETKELILGGVNIDYDKGLVGHSDADVLVHAIMDALLGASNLGDIGDHFPDTDPQYKGISSLKLLEHVKILLDEKGFRIINIDSNLIMQEPKIKPYIKGMIENISKTLDIDNSKVSIKATTEEKLGFTGTLQGIKAQAVCLIEEIK